MATHSGIAGRSPQPSDAVYYQRTPPTRPYKSDEGDFLIFLFSFVSCLIFSFLFPSVSHRHVCYVYSTWKHDPLVTTGVLTTELR